MITDSKDSIKFAKFLGIVCFITNISQMPNFVNMGITKLVAIPLWIITILILFFKKNIKFKTNIFFVCILSYVFIMSILACTIFTLNNYFNSSLVYPYLISIFIFMIGYFSSDNISYENIKYIIYGYIISSLLVAIDIYIKYFSGGFNWFSREYAYASKNSVSQILLTGLILLFIYDTPKKTIGKITKIVSIIFLSLIIFMLKSRASIIGILAMGIVVILSKNNSLKFKVVIIALTFILLISFNDNIYEIIINGVLLGGRDASNINDVSSGRFDMILNFNDNINNKWILGKGSGFVENFILSSFLQHGIFFGSIMIIIAIYPIIWGYRNLNKSRNLNIAFISIAISYSINGLFEEQAPFGPGVKCYFLWLMFGILLNLKKNKNTVIYRESK